MTSLWPARYLVAEWMTRSAPSSSARCRNVRETYTLCCDGVIAVVHELSHALKDETGTDAQERCCTGRQRHAWLTGVAKVESMQTVAPAAWHRRAMRRTSTQRRYGLVGDSEKNSVTSRSCSAVSRASRSDGSITCGGTTRRGSCQLR